MSSMNGTPMVSYRPGGKSPLIRVKRVGLLYAEAQAAVRAGIESGAVIPPVIIKECCRLNCKNPPEEGSGLCSEHRANLRKRVNVRKLTARVCQICSSDFKSPNPRSKYCSKKCLRKSKNEAKKAQRAKVKASIRPCMKCNEQFVPRRKWAKFCNTCRTSPGWGYWYERWLEQNVRHQQHGN